MSIRRLQRVFPLQQVCFWIAGACAGVFLSAFTTVATGQQAWLTATGALGLVAFVLGIAVELRERKEIDVAIECPITITTPEEAREYARRGFIGFVPLYRPQPQSGGARLTAEQRLAAANALDFACLDLEHSNFWPTIQAVKTHASKLEHVWLLPTSGENTAASAPYTNVLVEYLRPHLLATCRIHTGEDYAISLRRDSEVLRRTYKRVRAALGEAEALKLSRRELVADMTTGMRSMVLGMVLACLDREHDIEFVGARYDANGDPIQTDTAPVIFSFEPHL